MFTLNSAIRGLYAQRCNMEFRMRRVSLAITIYLLWEVRNKRVLRGRLGKLMLCSEDFKFCFILFSIFMR